MTPLTAPGAPHLHTPARTETPHPTSPHGCAGWPLRPSAGARSRHQGQQSRPTRPTSRATRPGTGPRSLSRDCAGSEGWGSGGARRPRRPVRPQQGSRSHATVPPPHLDVKVGRIKAAGRDQPCLGRPQIVRHQLPGSLHQELAVPLSRHDPGASQEPSQRPQSAPLPPLGPPPPPEPLRMSAGARAPSSFRKSAPGFPSSLGLRTVRPSEPAPFRRRVPRASRQATEKRGEVDSGACGLRHLRDLGACAGSQDVARLPRAPASLCQQAGLQSS